MLARVYCIVSNWKQVSFKNLLQSGNVQMIHAGIEEHGFVNRTISTVSWKFAIHVTMISQMNLQKVKSRFREQI